MKKLVLGVLIFCSIFMNVFSLESDFGGAAENVTGMSFYSNISSAKVLQQSDKVSLWLKLPLDREQTIFTAEGFYRYYLDTSTRSAESMGSNVNLIDLSLCSFKMRISFSNYSNLTFNLGRMPLTDLTGNIFSQSIDGLHLKYMFKNISFSLLGAYTGLLNASSVSIADTSFVYDITNVYPLADKYVVGYANVALSQLFSETSLDAEGFVLYRFSDSDVDMYYNASMYGGLSSFMYYNIATSVGVFKDATGSFYPTNMTKAEISAFLFDSKLSSTLIFTYASKDFMPYNKIYSDVCSTSYYSNIIKAGFLVTGKPLKNLPIVLGVDSLFIVEDSTSNIRFDAVQVYSTIKYQIVSDVLFSLNVGIKLPIGENNSAEDYYSCSGQVRITF